MFGNSAWKFTQLSQFWLQLHNKHKNMSAYSQEDSQCTTHCDFPFITVSIPEMKTPPQHNTRDHKAQGADFMITWVGAGAERVCTNPPSKQKHTHTGGRSLVWWCPGNPSVLTPGELLCDYRQRGEGDWWSSACMLRCVPTTWYPKAGLRAEGLGGADVRLKNKWTPQGQTPPPYSFPETKKAGNS